MSEQQHTDNGLVGKDHAILNNQAVHPVSPTGTFADDADIFAWMFMNPELFPTRSHFPGIPTGDDLVIPSPPLSPLVTVKQERDEQSELLGRRSSFEDDDDDDDSSSDSNNGPRSEKSFGNDMATSDGAAPASSSTTRRRATVTRTKSTSSNQSATGADGNDSRQKRLEKNREIARNCRKRKREKMEALEEEVQKLREWNRQLELKLKQIPENEAKEEVRKREVSDIARMIADHSRTSEQEMSKKLHQYKEVYSDFGRDRKQAITFHLEQLKSLMLPNQVSKMTLWCLQQDDDFYDEQRNKTTFGGGIWNLLCEELRLSEEQKRTLMGMRSEIRGQRKSVGECLRTLKELEKKITENIVSMGKQMAKIMSVTTPLQQARFLLWIEQNQDAVKVLNNIWEQKQVKIGQ